jgi:hypothetical protein
MCAEHGLLFAKCQTLLQCQVIIVSKSFLWTDKSKELIISLSYFPITANVTESGDCPMGSMEINSVVIVGHNCMPVCPI